MSEQKPRVAIVGEVLIELARETDGRFRLGYVGDTFNVAVYLARGGIETAFVTALGEDPYSDAVVALATAEGIAGDLMLRVRAQGYLIRRALISGGPYTCEWRGEAPVRSLRAAAWGGSPKPGSGEARVFLRHHALALFQCRARPFPCDPRSDPSQGRENKCSTEISGHAAGAETCRGRAPCSSKR
jgi:2-dehydro-3-deoxygluconokinase